MAGIAGLAEVIRQHTPLPGKNVPVVKENPQGITTKTKTDITYPTYKECGIDLNDASSVLRGINESKSSWMSRSSAARKCLRTPITFEVDNIEK